MPHDAGYALTTVPLERRPVLDRLAGASRRFQVHALLELDVSRAAARIEASGGAVTWTGFVIGSLARAVAATPEVNARKAGNRILTFDRVDVGATVEREWQGRRVLDILVLPAADALSCEEISARLHGFKHGPGTRRSEGGLLGVVGRLPGPLRRGAVRWAGSRPGISAQFGPAVGVTSLGMFSRGWGWAIPLAPLTVIATVGAVADRPAVHDGAVVVAPMLPITLTFDHAVVDGAPAARFVEALRELVETAAPLGPPVATSGATSA